MYLVNVDDCWQVSRDAGGIIQADPKTFPSGIRALADYVHSRKLKFGIYSGIICWLFVVYSNSLSIFSLSLRQMPDTKHAKAGLVRYTTKQKMLIHMLLGKSIISSMIIATRMIVVLKEDFQ
jgi:hypothetical protein